MNSVNHKSPEPSHGTYRSYSIGFILSVACTLLAYTVVVNDLLSRGVIAFIIIGLAIAQLVVQLLFFLHVGQETRPRWKLAVFVYMVISVCAIFFGSIWIMYNLDYNMHSHSDTEIIIDEGIQR